MSDALKYVAETARESAVARDTFLESHSALLVDAARAMARCIEHGGKVLLCGNGGSAADAQHMAAEMVGRMLVERNPLPAIALTTDSSNLTALANDFSYEVVFQKQVQALARKGDCLIAISTSGKSANVLAAAHEAKAKGCTVIALTGGEGGPLKKIADFGLNVAAGKNSSRIQETHIFIFHSLVDLMDRFFLKQSK